MRRGRRVGRGAASRRCDSGRFGLARVTVSGTAENFGGGLARDQGVVVKEQALEGVERFGAGFFGQQARTQTNERVVAGEEFDGVGLAEEGEEIGERAIVVGGDLREVQAAEEVGEHEGEVGRAGRGVIGVRGGGAHARSIEAAGRDARGEACMTAKLRALAVDARELRRARPGGCDDARGGVERGG